MSGDGIVFAPEAADHTGARNQSAARLFLWFIVTRVQHRQLRERLKRTKQVEVYYNKRKENRDKVKTKALGFERGPIPTMFRSSCFDH